MQIINNSDQNCNFTLMFPVKIIKKLTKPITAEKDNKIIQSPDQHEVAVPPSKKRTESTLGGREHSTCLRFAKLKFYFQ